VPAPEYEMMGGKEDASLIQDLRLFFSKGLKAHIFSVCEQTKYHGFS